VLFTTAVDAINALLAAQAAHRLGPELKKYLSPEVLILDKAGADLLFRIISQRYERSSIILTTNKAYKHWPTIFNNDAGITSAILDRRLHRRHRRPLLSHERPPPQRSRFRCLISNRRGGGAPPPPPPPRLCHHVDFLSARE
jgi:DNA replication protein DnaC